MSVTCFSILFLDRPVASFCGSLAPWIRTVAGWAGWPAGFPAAFVACSFVFALAAYLLWIRRSPVGARLLLVPAATALAWSAGNIAKVAFGRARPELLFEHGIYGFWFLRTEYELTSFPSGHAVIAVGFLFALSTILQRWRWLFWSLAALVGLSRVVSTAHYLGDVLAAATLSVAVVRLTEKAFPKFKTETQHKEE